MEVIYNIAECALHLSSLVRLSFWCGKSILLLSKFNVDLSQPLVEIVIIISICWQRLSLIYDLKMCHFYSVFNIASIAI